MDTAKLFTTGRSQAVRLPKQYRFDGSEVYIRRVGNTVVLAPKRLSWDEWLAALAQFDTEPWPDREQPSEQQRRPALAGAFKRRK